MARKYFKSSTVELREASRTDLAGVREELKHRKSRGARKLSDELGNGTPEPVMPVAAERMRKASKARKRGPVNPTKGRAERIKAGRAAAEVRAYGRTVTPQTKAMPGTAPLGKVKHRRDAQGRILSKAASAKLEAEELAADEDLPVAHVAVAPNAVTESAS